jgi:hypothetical protein
LPAWHLQSLCGQNRGLNLSGGMFSMAVLRQCMALGESESHASGKQIEAS